MAFGRTAGVQVGRLLFAWLCALFVSGCAGLWMLLLSLSLSGATVCPHPHSAHGSSRFVSMLCGGFGWVLLSGPNRD